MAKRIQIDKIKQELIGEILLKRELLSRRNITPRMAIVGALATPAIQHYAKAKEKVAKEFDIKLDIIDLANNVSDSSLIKILNELKNDEKIHGIFTELPFPSHINTEKVLSTIPFEKDVEGIGVFNLGMLFANSRQFVVRPTTAYACINLIESITEVKGKTVVIIGVGRVVGRPLLALLLNLGATVICCDKFSSNVDMLAKDANIIVSAAGCVNDVMQDETIVANKIVIDVGMGVDNNGEIVGDFSEEIREAASYYATGRNEVGKLTTHILFLNLLKLIEKNCIDAKK
ncbi:MAG: bifunctional 5,10-methylenetetrahydrofolate dehydrogenase/5,10-methenyltetrahydrofolate cyclohydrolase [Gammaproteobacteria bacterium]|nr:bifunctional 5,10-methylenetetrahydrofolate dehydrogenase/5,10-methenyltetrahydrofolate cyclohydrolase [Gammaproteobacteria bacterium]